MGLATTVACSSGPDGGDVDAMDAADVDTVDAGGPCEVGDTQTGVCEDGRLSASGECRPPDSYESDESTCDGLDNDCDGRRDERCDMDGDGFCRASKRVPEDRPGDVCRNGGGDCWDAPGAPGARRTYPGAAVKEGTSTCALDVDDDEYGAGASQIPPDVRDRVAGGADACDNQPRAWDASKCASCEDGDEDGYWAGCQTTLSNPPDCEDSDGTVYPSAEERCDGVDSDCDETDDPDDADADAFCEMANASGVVCRRDDSGTLCCSKSGESC